jgi:hypothetical protein
MRLLAAVEKSGGESRIRGRRWGWEVELKASKTGSRCGFEEARTSCMPSPQIYVLLTSLVRVEKLFLK